MKTRDCVEGGFGSKETESEPTRFLVMLRENLPGTLSTLTAVASEYINSEPATFLAICRGFRGSLLRALGEYAIG